MRYKCEGETARRYKFHVAPSRDPAKIPMKVAALHMSVSVRRETTFFRRKIPSVTFQVPLEVVFLLATYFSVQSSGPEDPPGGGKWQITSTVVAWEIPG